ncbi:VRR-NUC domain-containing protein [Enterobacter hormaechei subsp. hoffmannii]|nr:VRR-NUC domain-containing protein [Enterobacter hormaechei subsp. hoffmannii]
MRFSSEWLEGYNKRHGRRSGTKSPGASGIDFMAAIKKVSVHAAALAAMVKNPDLLKGRYEHYDQVRVFDYMDRKHPELYDLLHATPNGGFRAKKTGNDMTAEGQKKGYPDMSLDLAAGAYHGMRIELKHGKRKASKEQNIWLHRLHEQGYYCVLAFSPEEAIEAMLAYSRLSPGELMPSHENDDYWRDADAAA